MRSTMDQTPYGSKPALARRSLLGQQTSLSHVSYFSEAQGDLDRDGYQFLPAALSAQQADELGRAVMDAINEVPAPAVVRDDTGRIRMAFGLHLASPYVDTVARTGRWIHSGAETLGDELYLYQSKLTINPPDGSGGWGWHQDFHPWHDRDGVPKPDMVSAIVFLDDIRPESGGLSVVAGSHRLPPSEVKPLMERLEAVEGADPAAPLALSPIGPAGSVLVFHALSVHGSAPNRSTTDRRLLIYSYNSCRNVPMAHRSAEWLCARDTTPLAPPA